MTKLESAVLQLLKIPSLKELSALPKDEIKAMQAGLDKITPAIIEQLDSRDILDHTKRAYSETANEYANTTHNQMVIDELLEFMALLPEGARVLDIGCGPGRDVLFMSSRDYQFRLSLMERLKNGRKTLEKYAPPETAFRVVGLDQSIAMITKGKENFLKLKSEGMMFAYKPQFAVWDMHDLPAITGFGGELFAGIWSCAALFIHTPRALTNTAMQSVARLLDKDGIFFTSYLNGMEGPYDKLLLSSTGKIKYFSHQNPKKIVEAAKTCGLTLQCQILNDLEYPGRPAVKDFFVSQFFKKS